MPRSFGIFRKVVLLRDFGNQFVDQELREAAVDGIVFEDALEAALRVRISGGQDAGIDEDPDHRREIVLRDQVVEDHGT